MGRTNRNLLVWLHILTSVGWMSQALALFALNVYGMATGDRDAYVMAELLDENVLVHLANGSLFTGFMLSALTRWGYFQYWWVLLKAVISLVQLNAAIFLLGPALTALAEGEAVPTPAMPVGTLLMASAVAFQGWLSIAKPWKRTPWTAKPVPPPAPPAWFPYVVLAVPVADFALAFFVFGHPAPLFFVLTAVGYPLWRSRRLAPASAGA
ncbi:hypothetical protein ABZ917_22840 [Nonomuraea wenchangensis]